MNNVWNVKFVITLKSGGPEPAIIMCYKHQWVLKKETFMVKFLLKARQKQRF